MGLMIKLIIVGVAGYIVYRTVKTKIKTMIFGPQSPKEVKTTTNLVACEHCDRYIDAKSAIVHKKHTFCDRDCQQSYIKNTG